MALATSPAPGLTLGGLIRNSSPPPISTPTVQPHQFALQADVLAEHDPRVAAGWAAIKKDCDREVADAYTSWVNQRAVQRYHQLVRNRLRSFSVWDHVVSWFTGIAGKGFWDRAYAEIRAAYPKPTHWNPSEAYKVACVQRCFEALGCPEVGTTVVVDEALIQRVSPVAHEAPTTCLRAYRMPVPAARNGVYIGCGHNVQVTFIVDLIIAFGCVPQRVNQAA